MRNIDMTFLMNKTYFCVRQVTFGGFVLVWFGLVLAILVLTLARQAVLWLELLHQLFIVMGFFKIGSLELLARMALNCDPPDLCLLR
jgi:hypothetical protein